MWECPQLLRFPQGDALAISVWYNPHGGEHFVAYLSGDYQGNTFVPTGGSRYDWGDSFFAPQAFQDAQGRWISFGWLRERRPQEAQLNAGWSGCMTLPRVLSLSQGRLLQHPAPEVERLRGPGKVWERLEVKGEVDLGEWGQCVELAALLKPLTEPLVFDLRHSTHESTTLILDCPKHQLILDRSNSSLNPEVDHRTLTMPVEPKDLMGLRVFVDASVIEIYLDGQTLTSRIYPTRFEGLRLGLKGEVWVERIEIFPLQTP
jgi:beta-fructofuranosidase